MSGKRIVSLAHRLYRARVACDARAMREIGNLLSLLDDVEGIAQVVAMADRLWEERPAA